MPVGGDVSWGLFGDSEDYDTIPVVGVVNLSVAACSFEDEAVCIDAVVTGEDVSDSLSTAF